MINILPSYGAFYPDTKIEMIDQGDLAHNTIKAINRNCNWITDKIGYRNDNFIENPDVVLIGDSYFIGISLTQKKIFANKLMEKSGNRIKVFSMAPATFDNFDKLYSKNRIKKPSLIIYSMLERAIPAEFKPTRQNTFKSLVVI